MPRAEELLSEPQGGQLRFFDQNSEIRGRGRGLAPKRFSRSKGLPAGWHDPSGQEERHPAAKRATQMANSNNLGITSRVLLPNAANAAR